MTVGQHEGKIKVWKGERGFGFIKNKNGGSDVFVHVRDLRESKFQGDPMVGDIVRFEIGHGDRGPHAINISRAS